MKTLSSESRSWLLSEETQKKRNDGCLARSDELKAKDAICRQCFTLHFEKVEITSTTVGTLVAAERAHFNKKNLSKLDQDDVLKHT